MTGVVNTKEFSMKYIRFGRGRKTMIILPGLSLRSISSMAFLVENAYDIFAVDYTIYLLDRRDDAPENYSSLDMAADTYEALKKLGIKEASFLGLSQGGSIAMELALMCPDVVRTLAVGSTAAYVNEPSSRILKRWLDYAYRRNATRLATSMAEAIYSRKTLLRMRDSFVQSFSNLTESEFVQFINLCEGFKDYDIRDRLSDIKCPTLVLGCEGDKVFGADASREIHEKISSNNDRCLLFIYNKSYGHAVYDEAPDYKERVYEFFKDAES